jgi:hypothetical protein
MAIKEYVNKDWHAILKHNQTETFEQLWRLNQKGWFEQPNERRGGWSGVIRTCFSTPEGGEEGVFIKLQENHVYRSWLNPFRPVATLEREFRNIQLCRKLAIPTIEPIYFCQKEVGGKLRAILVSRELAGYQSADDESYNPISQISRPRRKQLIARIAHTINHMHQNHIQHNCLYPKHIFLRAHSETSYDVRFIDLESARLRFSRRSIAKRDIGTLYRHTTGWSRSDRLRLFLAYRGEERLSDTSRKLLAAILGQVKARKK